MDFLSKVVARKKQEVKKALSKVSLDDLQSRPAFSRKPLSLKSRLMESSGLSSPFGFSRVIAEIKRASPSRGMMHPEIDVVGLARNYERAGATAISVLTDGEGFGGSIDDILAIRLNVSIPILRKDFIIDPYQIYEAKAIGADIILLIAGAVSPDDCLKLAGVAKDLSLEVLLEVHAKEDIDAFDNDLIDFIGVNNRDLKTLKVDVDTSFKLFEFLPKNKFKVSESGISKVETIKSLRESGYDLFLIGEVFMSMPDPGASCMDFISQL